MTLALLVASCLGQAGRSGMQAAGNTRASSGERVTKLLA